MFLKRFIAIFLLLSQTRSLFAQMTNNITMEAAPLIKDSTVIRDFINAEFVDYSRSGGDTFNDWHPLSMHRVNRTLKHPERKFTLFNLPIDSIYAYTSGEHQFCLYFILSITRADLNTIAENFGNPDNIPYEDFVSGDYDFLNWIRKEFDILLFEDKLTSQSGKAKIQSVLLMTNMRFNSLFNDDELLRKI